MAERRLSDQTSEVLRLFLNDPLREIYGREIIVKTRIPSGSLYPILHRLEATGFLVSKWETLERAAELSRRPRREYRLNPDAADQARAALNRRRRSGAQIASHRAI